MAVNAPAWVFLSALTTLVLCQVTQSDARSFHPPHTIFGSREGFERQVRKMPPFALFGMNGGRQALVDDGMWRAERKVPPFAIFGKQHQGDSFERDARIIPPFTVFGAKGRSTAGKREEDDFPMA